MRVAIVVQRDLLGALAGFLVALDKGEERTPIEECEGLAEAQDRARQLMGQHGCRAIKLDDEVTR